MPRVAAVIVTHNRKEKLLRCIEAVLMQDSEILPDIFIVDNDSTDGTGEEVSGLLSKVPDRIIYSNLRHNSGGAGGFCYGIRKATEAGYDFIWLMDDDCRADTAALREFLHCDQILNGNYGFLSGRAYWTDGSLCKMNMQRRSLTRKVSERENGLIKIET
jgi:glycosyltransferase involved in cell wall biosynthesis